MKLGLITTLDTNIGDDFIREGLCNVLRGEFGEKSLQFLPVNKHKPLSLYSPSHPLVRIRRLPINGYRKRNLLRQFSRLFHRVGSTHFDSCDAILQCGAPVYWKGCGTQTDWSEDLWQDVVARLHRRIPVLNLAAGSCFAVRNLPETFEDPADATFVRWLYGLCRTTTVRDPLAKKLLESVGCPTDVIRCSAFLFTNPSQSEPTADGPVLINYMEGGGHYDWDQKIDRGRWEQTTRQVIAELRRKHRVVMLCHNAKEKQLAEKLAPDLEHVLPGSYRDFPRVVRQAKAALCNRMHASVALAGMGIPSVTVGSDTRLLMVEQLGLPCHFVEDVDAATIVRELEHQMTQRYAIAAELAQKQEETRRAYARVFRAHLPLAALRAA